MPDELTVLHYEALRAAVAGTSPAFRLRLKLQPAGGQGDKIFPPTYESGKYAEENRRIKGVTVSCVLLDSVQSQANRMEMALLRAWEDGKIELPVISSDFSGAGQPGLQKVSSLEAPHRIADAILRDSTLDGKEFRESAIGRKLDTVTAACATALFEHCPTSLVFGMWDSTGKRKALGVKFARAIVSEIVGINAVKGVKIKSRIDPLQIRKDAGIIFEAKDGGWTLDEKEAVKEKNKSVRVGDGRPSEINHGNYPPTIDEGGLEFPKESGQWVNGYRGCS
jgi:CRISPR-associated protein Csb1